MQNEIKDDTTVMTAPKAARQLPLAGLCFLFMGKDQTFKSVHS